jgi:hypothetical protein
MFHLLFINLIINLNSSFNYVNQVFRSIYLANLVFNRLLKALIELGCKSVTFLI